MLAHLKRTNIPPDTPVLLQLRDVTLGSPFGKIHTVCLVPHREELDIQLLKWISKGVAAPAMVMPDKSFLFIRVLSKKGATSKVGVHGP